jgi:hypothetical protein
LDERFLLCIDRLREYCGTWTRGVLVDREVAFYICGYDFIQLVGMKEHLRNVEPITVGIEYWIFREMSINGDEFYQGPANPLSFINTQGNPISGHAINSRDQLWFGGNQRRNRRVLASTQLPRGEMGK